MEVLRPPLLAGVRLSLIAGRNLPPPPPIETALQMLLLLADYKEGPFMRRTSILGQCFRAVVLSK